MLAWCGHRWREQSTKMDGAAPQAQQQAVTSDHQTPTTVGMLGLRLRRRVDTRDEDRRCEGRQPPFRARAIRLGVVPEIACLTQDAFAPHDNRKSRIAGAA